MPGTTQSTGNSGMNETNNHCPSGYKKRRRGRIEKSKSTPTLNKLTENKTVFH